MASLPQHLPLLLLISFLHTSIYANTVCPSFDCGNGNAISYPFWQQNQQLEHCGYPAFKVSCINHNPLFHLSDNIYTIKTINHTDNSITLAYVGANICTTSAHHVSITLGMSSSSLNFSSENTMLRFFYNCTLYPPSLKSISCLEYGGKRSYVFDVGAVPEFDWRGYCESIVTVPVIGKASDFNFSRILQEGFKLTWRPESACQSCEASGGFCGFSNLLQNNFFCLCSDGRRSLNCHDQGDASIMFEPTYVAMGALIFSGLIVAATVFYSIHKKKSGLQYKPVSSNGK